MITTLQPIPPMSAQDPVVFVLSGIAAQVDHRFELRRACSCCIWVRRQLNRLGLPSARFPRRSADKAQVRFAKASTSRQHLEASVMVEDVVLRTGQTRDQAIRTAQWVSTTSVMAGSRIRPPAQRSSRLISS